MPDHRFTGVGDDRCHITYRRKIEPASDVPPTIKMLASVLHAVGQPGIAAALELLTNQGRIRPLDAQAVNMLVFGRRLEVHTGSKVEVNL